MPEPLEGFQLFEAGEGTEADALDLHEWVKLNETLSPEEMAQVARLKIGESAHINLGSFGTPLMRRIHTKSPPFMLALMHEDSVCSLQEYIAANGEGMQDEGSQHFVDVASLKEGESTHYDQNRVVRVSPFKMTLQQALEYNRNGK